MQWSTNQGMERWIVNIGSLWIRLLSLSSQRSLYPRLERDRVFEAMCATTNGTVESFLLDDNGEIGGTLVCSALVGSIWETQKLRTTQILEGRLDERSYELRVLCSKRHEHSLSTRLSGAY